MGLYTTHHLTRIPDGCLSHYLYHTVTMMSVAHGVHDINKKVGLRIIAKITRQEMCTWLKLCYVLMWSTKARYYSCPSGLLQCRRSNVAVAVTKLAYPDCKVHGANMGPIWGRQDPGGPHVGPMNFAIWVYSEAIGGHRYLLGLAQVMACRLRALTWTIIDILIVSPVTLSERFIIRTHEETN